MRIHIHSSPLTGDQIKKEQAALHVWTKVPALTKFDPSVNIDETMLSPPELERASRFHFEADYLTYVAAHALLRRALSQFSRIAPRDWQFDTGPHGRPFIRHEMNPTDIRFNISHTRTLVACAVTQGVDCGIDVETIGRSKDPLSLAKYNFTHAEYRTLKNLQEPARQEHFTALWCLKEAYLKAEGVGITVPLSRASFVIDHPDGGITHNLSDSDDRSKWRFKLFRPTENHFGAVALKSR